MSKYHAKKITVDGITYDSQKEYRRHRELLLMEKAGAITELRRQVRYVLIPAQREADKIGARGGIIQGKLIERECCYIADFVYKQDGKVVVEDCKGFKPPEYKIKKKLMLWRYSVRIKET